MEKSLILVLLLYMISGYMVFSHQTSSVVVPILKSLLSITLGVFVVLVLQEWKWRKNQP